MFRKLPTVAVASVGVAHRSVASYGKTILTHQQVAQKYQSAAKDNGADELRLLETVESRIRSWRLNKWEFRVPVLLSQAEKEVAQLQLHTIKTLILDHGKTQDMIDHDMKTVCDLFKITAEELRLKPRSWLQEQLAELRWKGEVQKAKSVRDAFLRLETYGSRDFRYFERLCCIYGLAKLGTFEDAFSNIVVPDGNSIRLEGGSPLAELMGILTTKYPTLDIIYDFLGFNALEGYRSSLGRYLTAGLEHKHGVPTPASRQPDGSRILFQKDAGKDSREILFDFKDSAKAILEADVAQGVADFVHVVGHDVTLITVATANQWMKSRQIAHRKQLEGIARRATFVLGIPFEKARVRNLVLPPSYVDRRSLDRLNQNVLRLDDAQVQSFAPWVQLYEKELDMTRDQEYDVRGKTAPEEDWVKL